VSVVAAVRVGDWFETALWPGIWQVYRVESGFFEERWHLAEPKVRSSRTLVFVRRIVGDSGQRAFDTQACEASLVAPLSDKQLSRLNDRLGTDPKLAAAFAQYEPKPIDLVTNIGFGLPDDFGYDRFSELCGELLSAPMREGGVTLDDVLRLLADSELEEYRGEIPQTTTLQLISPDHRRRGDEFVSTDFRTLDF